MKVRELIEELQKIEDKELPVFVYDSSYWNCEVDQVLIEEDVQFMIGDPLIPRAIKLD